MKIGRRIYYEIKTGSIIQEISERQGNVVPSTVERDIKNYKALSERNRDTFDFIELEYDQYAQDFAESNGYRVNLETKELEFFYPNPNEPEAPPVYQAPLSEQVEELKQKNSLLEARNNALSERADFIEDVVAEMATQIYQ